jgi:Na+/proline symporter
MIQQLSPIGILGIIFGYFLLLIVISYFTSRDSDNESFFLADRKSPWPLVAWGMIGASLSGVTFISVPGAVGGLTATGAPKLNFGLSYLQVVFGYLLGYAVIALVLLPLYYRMGLTSIYEYLRDRFGRYSHKVGAFYFLLSRTIGASFRLFLVALVLDMFVTGPLGLPFGVTVALTILLIWVYTFKGGIKTIVYTDSLQTLSMLLAVGLTVIAITQSLDSSLLDLPALISQSGFGQIFYFENGWSDPNNFFKQFLSGALITIVMTGLDQDMMQKNLSISNVRDSQKNMLVFSIILVFANLLFLSLGALLYIYAANIGLPLPASSDQLFPTVALQHLSPFIGIVFMLGLIAAAYSSADSALTALTTSFCMDFLNFRERENEQRKQRTRLYVHIGFSVLILITILIFRTISDDSVINSLFRAAGYTYGPLLGLFSFGILTNLRVREEISLRETQLGRFLPDIKIPALLLICLLSPVLSFLVDKYSTELLYGFEFGFLILAFNGLLTFVGLLAISYREYEPELEDAHPPAA